MLKQRTTNKKLWTMPIINKPNLVRRRRIPKMNANAFLQKDYENETTLRPKKTNPIQTQLEAWRNNDKLCASSAETDEKSNTPGRTLGKCLKRRFFRRNVNWIYLGVICRPVLLGATAAGTASSSNSWRMHLRRSDLLITPTTLPFDVTGTLLILLSLKQ